MMKTVRRLGKNLAPGDTILPWYEKTARIESLAPYQGAYESLPAWQGARVAIFDCHSEFAARHMIVFADQRYDVVIPTGAEE